ncbi:hypothetical protein PhaeoP92_00481 [Phaeobacter inhibens]|nr:hypothetical protein PhaeoP92_00481 [Phaeobacter inhibens]
MPGPTPGSVWIEVVDGRACATFERYLWSDNFMHRLQRATALTRRVSNGSWVCRWCGNELPDFRRTDALYCGESCRKKAARQRRRDRAS